MAQTTRFFETVWQDVGYALRLFRRQPGYSAMAMLTLALGVGAATALFSVIDAAVLHPLPYVHPERLANALVVAPPDPQGRSSKYAPSLAELRLWRSLPSVAASATFRPSAPVSVVDAGGGPERVVVSVMSEGMLEVCGLPPVIGRGLTEADVSAGAPPVVLLGYRYWRSHFAGRADVLGKTVRFVDANGWAGPPGTATIVGVVPESFFPAAAMWRGLAIDTKFKTDLRRGSGRDVVLRLAPGASIADVASEAATLANRDAAAADRVAGVELTSWLSESSSGYASTLNVLAGAVALVLVIGCINIAGLLFARGAARRPELAIRASVGATRSRLIRQLFTESAVLAAIGGGTGVLLAWLFLDTLTALVPLRLPSSSTVAINGPVLAAALVLSVVTAILFGIAPAVAASRVSIAGSLGGGGRHGGTFSRRIGQVLIAVEVALAVVMLAGAGLLVRSLLATTSVDVGLDPSKFVSIDVAPLSQEPDVLTAYYRDVADRLRAMPGVAAVGVASSFPIGGRTSQVGFFRVGSPGSRSLGATQRNVTPGYVEAIGQRLVRGRIPTTAELSGDPLLVINESAAAEWFPGGDAIGRAVVSSPDRSATVVGVIADVRQDGPLSKPRSEVLVYSTAPVTSPMWVLVRAAPGVRLSTTELRHVASDIGPRVFVDEIRTGADWLSDRVQTPRHRAALFGLLGGLGLVLTLVGTFGVTGYAVTRRTQEIAVRMAFGARPGQVVATVLAASLWPAAIGALAGLGAAFLSTRVIATFLFQVSPTDPVTLVAVCALVALAAALAAWLPARRTSRVDPVQVLRQVQ
jgi:putative ABC transport system permease protein